MASTFLSTEVALAEPKPELSRTVAAEVDPEVRLEAVAAAARELGALGHSYDALSQTIVLRVPAGQPVTPLITAVESIPVRTRILESTFTSAALQQVEEVLKQGEWLAGKEGVSYSFVYDAVADAIELTTDAADTEVNALQARFKNQITVREGRFRRGSRTVDPSPHKGGAGIRGSNGNLCSSGMAVQRQGTRYMVTAGHCYPNGTGIRDESGANYVGSTFGRSGYPNYDMTLIGDDGQYSRDIYSRGASGVRIPVISAASPTVGGSYCRSGRTTFEHCGLVVNSVAATACDENGQCTGGLARYTGASLGAQGDSGAPFYAKTSEDQAKIRGIRIGYDQNYGYVEQWQFIASHLGVSIATTPL